MIRKEYVCSGCSRLQPGGTSSQASPFLFRHEVDLPPQFAPVEGGSESWLYLAWMLPRPGYFPALGSSLSSSAPFQGLQMIAGLSQMQKEQGSRTITQERKNFHRCRYINDDKHNSPWRCANRRLWEGDKL